MAHSLSAKKRIRQNEKQHARNKWRKRGMREAIRAFLEKVAHGSPEEAGQALSAAASVIDRTAARGVIHKNQANRRKARLAARLKVKVGHQA